MAIREGDLKLIVGHSGWSRFSGWYPPPQVTESIDTFTTMNNPEVHSYEMEINKQRTTSNLNYYEEYMRSTTRRVLNDMGRTVVKPQPATIDCKIPKPANASQNCDLKLAPCLYNITADPCEYVNLAPSHPELLEMMLRKLEEHSKTVVHIRNKPLDKKSIPPKHNGTWAPWVDEWYDMKYSPSVDMSVQQL